MIRVTAALLKIVDDANSQYFASLQSFNVEMLIRNHFLNKVAVAANKNYLGPKERR